MAMVVRVVNDIVQPIRAQESEPRIIFQTEVRKIRREILDEMKTFWEHVPHKDLKSRQVKTYL